MMQFMMTPVCNQRPTALAKPSQDIVYLSSHFLKQKKSNWEKDISLITIWVVSCEIS